MKILNKKTGFTLAEVLVTLGVIGVLAVVIIPSVQKTMPNKNYLLFRKTYNTLSSTVNDLLNDDVDYPSTQFGTDSNGANVLR